MIFDGIDTLYEVFYAYVESVVEEENNEEAPQPELAETNSGWTWEEEELSRHSTILLAS